MSIDNDRSTLCQTCQDVEVEGFLSLGLQPAFHFPADTQEAEAEQLWPLELGFCPRCSLVQVMEQVSERILFAGEYHHQAGLVASFRTHLEGLADTLASLREPAARPGSVVEIGSNDGTLLDALAERGFEVLGVDPCGTESSRGSKVVPDYFSSEVAKRLRVTNGAADLVVALNSFAHVTDAHDVVDGVCAILGADGVFVSESHYLPDLLDGLQYDFAYHEHPRNYSLTALQALLEMHGLEVFRVENLATHGGSFRVYAGFQGAHGIEASVTDLRRREDSLGLTDRAIYAAFATQVQNHRDELRLELKRIAGDGSRIAGASAPGRAITMLTYCGLGPADLEYISDIGPRKIGKLLPGAHIPIVGQEVLCGPDQPEYALLLSWHIFDEIVPRLRAEGFRGKFVVPLPEPRVLHDV
ncbi:class I SAM-dependent methyltransferase [Amycolatopsis sp. OK19-0408]|uniref:Class I SAM-dependent methyltransferase n=1 Tax=Amycolatopsis iheyensis TaxID=2945988 RepID=A0A9X2SK49_9PSEU|nr:class I SAM-dependent methyltransferase [Amycolatopsis iheyensis]MCR6483491.1 class I SAM-dependent methyltransferase [Amycolatopsis iheyensis]